MEWPQEALRSVAQHFLQKAGTPGTPQLERARMSCFPFLRWTSKMESLQELWSRGPSWQVFAKVLKQRRKIRKEPFTSFHNFSIDYKCYFAIFC